MKTTQAMSKILKLLTLLYLSQIVAFASQSRTADNVTEPEFNEVRFTATLLVLGTMSFGLETTTADGDLKRGWLTKRSACMGYKYVDYDPNTATLVVEKGGAGYLLTITKGTIYHTNPKVALSREHALLAMDDHLNSMLNAAKKLKNYRPVHQNLSSTDSREHKQHSHQDIPDSVARALTPAGGQTPSTLTYYGSRGEQRVTLHVKRISAVKLPEAMYSNLVKSDWDEIDLRHGAIVAARMFAEDNVVPD